MKKKKLAENWPVGQQIVARPTFVLAKFEKSQKWPKKLAQNLENEAFWPKFGPNSAHSAPNWPKLYGPGVGPLNWASFQKSSF